MEPYFTFTNRADTGGGKTNYEVWVSHDGEGVYLGVVVGSAREGWDMYGDAGTVMLCKTRADAAKAMYRRWLAQREQQRADALGRPMRKVDWP